jgi:hypothetical protein
MLAMSHHIGDPNVIRSLALSPFSGRFTEFHADNVKADGFVAHQ